MPPILLSPPTMGVYRSFRCALRRWSKKIKCSYSVSCVNHSVVPSKTEYQGTHELKVAPRSLDPIEETEDAETLLEAIEPSFWLVSVCFKHLSY